MSQAGGVCALVIVLSGCLLASCENDVARGPASAPPVTRIVTLAPNLTELVYAVGAGDTLVGVSAHSDYPEAARALPLVGDAFTVDQERLAVLAPDLLLVWESGTPAHIVDELQSVGYRVEVLRTRSLEDVARALTRIGELTGRVAEATSVAEQYRRDLDSLTRKFAGSANIRVFYQVSRRPVYTVSGEHYVSELIERCGGTNVFHNLGELAPAIAVEAVIAADPEVMLASSDAGSDAFTEWQRWPQIAANRFDNRFLLPADEIGRATTRLVIAGEALCTALETGRARRDAWRGQRS